jgi:glycosyltransferase involved in cell wall biosynthesis
VDSKRRPRLLLISPTDYQSAVAKGVVSLLSDFDESGFFQQVLIAFPLARTSSFVQVSDRVSVQDIGTDWLPFRGRFRWIRRLASPLHFVRVFKILIRYIRANHVDIIRATDPCFSGSIALVVGRLTRRPFCVSLHADLEKRYELGGPSAGTTILGSRAFARAVERVVLRRAFMVLPIRESLRPYAVASGASPDRVRVFPHGTDLTEFVSPSSVDVRELFGLAAGTKVVSFVGRLVRENYVDDILEVARRLGSTRGNVAFLVVGGGLEEDRFRTLVDQDPVLRRMVRLTGFQSRSVVAAVRRESSVSLCLMGGFSLIEACAAGSPVIAYDVEWHGELVRDAETGFLIRERDIEQVYAKVVRLLDDSELAKTMGRSARELVLAHHDIAKTAAIKRRCYLEMLASCGPAAGR